MEATSSVMSGEVDETASALTGSVGGVGSAGTESKEEKEGGEGEKKEFLDSDLRVRPTTAETKDDIQNMVDMRLALSLGVDISTLGVDGKSAYNADEEFLVTEEEERMIGIADERPGIDRGRYAYDVSERRRSLSVYVSSSVASDTTAGIAHHHPLPPDYPPTFF